MARGNKTVVQSGPWLGMEERENYQTDGHCQLALNVDFSRGYIEGRKGMKLIQAASTMARRARLHVHRKNGNPEYIISIGPGDDAGVNNVIFRAFDSSGTVAYGSSAQNISAAFGEPPDLNFECSFVSVIIVGRDEANNPSEPHFVTMITTRNNSYIYDPTVDHTAIRAVDMDNDPINLNELNFGYWINPPRGHIATEHQGRVYYAGFEDGYSVHLSRTLDALQALIPDVLIKKGKRGHFQLGPQFIAWSDEYDPVGIMAPHVMSVEEHEKVTGLRSFQEQLIIFTDKSIYAKTGGSDETFKLFKVVSDVGCVAPNSIIEVAGVLMFMAKDGIYAFAGIGQQGAVQKISKPIDSIFTGRMANTYIPEKVRDVLFDRGWPFKAKLDHLTRSNAVHVQSRNQIWWSINLQGTPAEGWALTLVYDYYHQAWSMFTHALANLAGFMYDGVTATVGGRERVFTSSPYGGLQKYSGGIDVTDASSNIPMIYLTGRMFKDNNSVNLYRPMRLKMLSHGDSGEMDGSPMWMAYGEEAHADAQFIDAAGDVQDAASADRQYTEGDITLHPNEGMNFFYGVGSYEDGASPITYQSRDWFTSKIESASVRSRSLRMGFFSGLVAASFIRPPELTIQSIAVEVVPGDTR